MRLLAVLMGFPLLAAVAAFADPLPPGAAEAEFAGKPGAAALGAGTIFLTQAAIRAPESGVVFLSGGQALASLDEPVGSCRLRLRVAGAEIPRGTPLTVETVDSARSAYDDRGISSVTWRFAEGDPAELLLCDTVGSGGPTQGDVEAEVRGLLKIEAAGPPPG